jgi:hypothetical protein
VDETFLAIIAPYGCMNPAPNIYRAHNSTRSGLRKRIKEAGTC